MSNENLREVVVKNLREMVVNATALGWTLGEFPASFEHRDKTWTQEEVTTAENGEIQCANYKSGEEWLIVANV
jgi:hypothetical protein